MMRASRVSHAYLPVFCQELYQLVRAGLPLDEGLALLREDESDPNVLAWLDRLCKSTGEGMPLSSALRETEAFPSYMTDMIALSEQTGTLDKTLHALSVHYDRQRRMRSDVSRAVAVPLALFAVMLAVVVLLMTQVLPVFDRVFAQLGVRMSGLGLSLMEAGEVLADAGVGIALVLAVLASAALIVALVPALRTGFAGWFRRSFGGRGVLGAVASTRFASAMAMASASGLLMEECVELSAKLCGGAKEVDEKLEACRKELLEGGRTAEALAHSGLFSARDSRLLMLAERTGSLPETLDSIARRSEEDTLARIDRMVGAIEPAIVILTAVLTGIILLSVMLPLLSIMSTLG